MRTTCSSWMRCAEVVPGGSVRRRQASSFVLPGLCPWLRSSARCHTLSQCNISKLPLALLPLPLSAPLQQEHDAVKAAEAAAAKDSKVARPKAKESLSNEELRRLVIVKPVSACHQTIYVHACCFIWAGVGGCCYCCCGRSAHALPTPCC